MCDKQRMCDKHTKKSIYMQKILHYSFHNSFSQREEKMSQQRLIPFALEEMIKQLEIENQEKKNPQRPERKHQPYSKQQRKSIKRKKADDSDDDDADDSYYAQEAVDEGVYGDNDKYNEEHNLFIAKSLGFDTYDEMCQISESFLLQNKEWAIALGWWIDDNISELNRGCEYSGISVIGKTFHKHLYNNKFKINKNRKIVLYKFQ